MDISNISNNPLIEDDTEHEVENDRVITVHRAMTCQHLCYVDFKNKCDYGNKCFKFHIASSTTPTLSKNGKSYFHACHSLIKNKGCTHENLTGKQCNRYHGSLPTQKCVIVCKCGFIRFLNEDGRMFEDPNLEREYTCASGKRLKTCD